LEAEVRPRLSADPLVEREWLLSWLLFEENPAKETLAAIMQQATDSIV
jgi:hypothetical protein